jgi:outer membrane protein TolC
LTWEPFDWGRKRNLVSEKAKAVDQASNGALETRSQVAVEVGLKYRKWHDTALLLKASRIAQQASAEKFRVTSNKYKDHAALIRDVLQAQAQTSEASYQYQQALSAYWSAFADLRGAMGEE